MVSSGGTLVQSTQTCMQVVFTQLNEAVKSFVRIRSAHQTVAMHIIFPLFVHIFIPVEEKQCRFVCGWCGSYTSNCLNYYI